MEALQYFQIFKNNMKPQNKSSEKGKNKVDVEAKTKRMRTGRQRQLTVLFLDLTLHAFDQLSSLLI